MSEFFESEIVREELDKINKMQDDIYNNLFTFTSLSYEDKVEHIEKLEILLEKQRLMYTRLSLSDDLIAIEMKKNLEKFLLSNKRRLGWLLGVGHDQISWRLHIMYMRILLKVSIIRLLRKSSNALRRVNSKD